MKLTKSKLKQLIRKQLSEGLPDPVEGGLPPTFMKPLPPDATPEQRIERLENIATTLYNYIKQVEGENREAREQGWDRR
jgi:hypothetical protein